MCFDAGGSGNSLRAICCKPKQMGASTRSQGGLRGISQFISSQLISSQRIPHSRNHSQFGKKCGGIAIVALTTVVLFQGFKIAERALFNLSIPLKSPTMSSAFGWRLRPVIKGNASGSGFHKAIDLTSKHGSVAAVESGRVIFTGRKGGLGNVVAIHHDNIILPDLISIYGHLRSISVAPGQSVKEQQVIGIMGSTGKASGPNLHLILLRERWLRGEGDLNGALKGENFVIIDPSRLLDVGDSFPDYRTYEPPPRLIPPVR